MNRVPVKPLNPGLYNAARIIEQRQRRFSLLHGRIKDAFGKTEFPQAGKAGPTADVPRYKATEAWPPTASVEFPTKFEKPALVRKLAFLNPAYYDYMQFRNFMRFFFFGFIVVFWLFHEQLNWIMNWNRVNSMQRVYEQTIYESRLSWMTWFWWHVKVGRNGRFNAEHQKVGSSNREDARRDGEGMLAGGNPLFIELAMRNRESARILANGA